VSVALTVWRLKEISEFAQLQATQINPVLICEKMNASVVPQYVLHFVITTLFLLAGKWKLFGINLPLALLRVSFLVKRTHNLTPAGLGGEKVHGSKGITFSMRLWLSTITHGVTALLCGYEWYSC